MDSRKTAQHNWKQYLLLELIKPKLFLMILKNRQLFRLALLSARHYCTNVHNPTWKYAPPRFLKYLNRPSCDTEYFPEETGAFLSHCPYLAVRWDLVNAFVQQLSRWLNDITRKRILDSIKSPDTIPYILFSLVRLHQQWSRLGDSAASNKTSDGRTPASLNAQTIGEIVSPWPKAIDGPEFALLIDRMVDVGFNQCQVVDLTQSCQALRYFVRNVVTASSGSRHWPSDRWLGELMRWICVHLTDSTRKNKIRAECDSSIGPTLLMTMWQFDEILPSGQYELVLRTLTDLSKEKFRDYIAESRSSQRSIDAFDSRQSIGSNIHPPRLTDYGSPNTTDYRSVDSNINEPLQQRRSAAIRQSSASVCFAIPSPQTFLDFSTVWLSWCIDPDDRDLAPGSWRVWYGALFHSCLQYAEIGSREEKPRNSFVVRNAPVFSKLIIDMVTVARLFGKESIFADTGAKGAWDQWALLTAFYCKPHVAAWLLNEMRAIENICVTEKGLDAILPKEFMRPELKKHLEFLANRKLDVEKLNSV